LAAIAALEAAPRLRRLLDSPLARALTTPHGVDRYLELVQPTWSLREVRAGVVAIRHQTADSITLTLRPNRAWRGFEAGQHLRLIVEIAGVQRTRCYSPAGSAHATDGHLELTVKAHPHGLVSRFLNRHADAGMVVGLSQAEGDFTLPAQRPEHLLLISGGSGITPVMSMLRTLCDEGHAGRITFLHYAFTERDVIYGPELAELAARHPNLSLVRAYTDSDGGELHGLFSRDHLGAAVAGYELAETYVCGPPGLMDAVAATWEDDGIADRLHVERFTPPAFTPSSEDARGTVMFAGCGVEAPNSGRPLLEQAEAAGLRPEHGCRMGICRTCTRRKLAGSVRNLQSGQLSGPYDEDIQLCVSVPVGDVAVDL
jgi:ferredoxin-NADP reductase